VLVPSLAIASRYIRCKIIGIWISGFPVGGAYPLSTVSALHDCPLTRSDLACIQIKIFIDIDLE
jgi:hypothetical protein